MAYIALYRKYRSQSFGELMGQDGVTTVLQNSLRSGRIAHAYLFFGARGCGKTSTARLLSRALNCVAQDGPTADPCGVCRLCVAIREGACMDVVEIDAASETGVDNVREKIIENVQYVPTEARYKVYIIDEVHDLSAKAFDALLKTLEEPPPHVVFVLATTEQHKVPITIRSRCIPFQFKRGTLADLSAAIERVVSAEGYSAEPAAVRAIARCAEGSWRDALSLLEQVIAYTGETITEESVQLALGTVGSEALGRVVETLARDIWADTLEIAGELIDSGKDVRQLITSLSGYLRDILLIASGAINTAAMELGSERTEQLIPQATLFSSGQLLTMLGILAAAEKETRVNNQHRWLLERTLCSMMPANLAAAERTQAPPQHLRREAAPRPSERAASPPKSTSASGPSHETTSYRTVPPPASSVERTEPASTEAEPSAESPADAASASRFMGDVTLEIVKKSWPRVLKAILQTSPSAAGYLQKASVIGLEKKVIILAFSDTFSRDRIMNKGKELVEKKICQVLQSEGYRIRVGYDGEGGASGGESADRPQDGNGSPAGGVTSTLDLSDGGNSDLEQPKPGRASPEEPPGMSLLEESLEVFGGEVIRSEPYRGNQKK